MDRRARGDKPGTIRVLIADDHAVLRAGLRMLLDAETDIEVVGEAGNGTEALAQVHKLAPDVVLLDITMPGMGGLEALRRISEEYARTRVLILTMHDDEGYLRDALGAGAAGYVLKQAADTELISAIRAIHDGGTYLHPAHTRLLLEGMIDREKAESRSVSASTLSTREEEVLRLVALGHTNQQVADTLYLSVKTVETYRARLMAKLGLQTRADLVRYAMQKGLLDR